jgi:hypothetical protein
MHVIARRLALAGDLWATSAEAAERMAFSEVLCGYAVQAYRLFWAEQCMMCNVGLLLWPWHGMCNGSAVARIVSSNTYL